MRNSLLPTALLACALLSACAIPPRPQAPDLSRQAPLNGVPASTDSAWPAAGWWQRYDDAQLNELETRALAGSPTLAVAQSRFEQALRSVNVARAAGGASVEGNAQVQRLRLSEHGLIPSEFLGFNWYNQGDLGVQFKYDFDFWGSQGSAIAAALDNARAAAAERDSASSMLTAAVAQTYFGWQADQARLKIAHDMLNIALQTQRIAAARVKQGIEPADSVQNAKLQTATAREQIAAIEGTAEIHRAALAALLGTSPAGLPKLESRPLPKADTRLPTNASLDLVARRADVAASRWRVDAALRDVDIARDAFYPDLSISAMLGLSSIDLGKLLSPGSTVVAAGPALHLPIFESGRLRARFGVSKAKLAVAVAAYNDAVVEAARDVATQALTLQQLQSRLREQNAQIQASKALQATASARARRGLTDARPVLASAADLDRLHDARIQLDAAAVSADVALIRALGGGYRTKESAMNNKLGATPR